MLYRHQSSVKLIDSQRHGAGCELLVVEGDSAAQSAANVRHKPTQAVLPLQGKPLNAGKASAAKVAESALYRQLAAALGLPAVAGPDAAAAAALDGLRFERLVLLFDPDADGIHIGALVLLYLQRWHPLLLQQHRVWMVRPPVGALHITDADTGEITVQHAYSQEHLRALRTQVQGQPMVQSVVYRGLGSMPPEVLRDTCVAPATRHAHAVTAQDVQMVAKVFGGG